MPLDTTDREEYQRFLKGMSRRDEAEALVWKGQPVSFRDLERRRRSWADVWSETIAPGQVVGLQAEYSPDSISLLLHLLEKRAVAALVPPETQNAEHYLKASQADLLVRFGEDRQPLLSRPDRPDRAHPLLQKLRRSGQAGLIIFSSGSSGAPKAILHALDRFLGKFEKAKKSLRTVALMRFDHLAGLDTLFYSLFSGSTLILPDQRDPESICRLIERTRAQVLPASPSFLNLLCLSGAYRRHDCSSLRIIACSSEVLGRAVLDRLAQAFPGCRLIQKYGMSEIGSPRSISREDDERWIRFIDEKMEFRIIDGILWLKSRGAMLGYLDRPSPVGPDGWYCTGDQVEVDGDWIRILGRQSEIINVGGEKVNPAEVEEVLLGFPGVAEAVVWGESNPLMGQIVCAALRERAGGELSAPDLRRYCRRRLERYKVPIKWEISQAELTTARYKKERKRDGHTDRTCAPGLGPGPAGR